MILSLYWSLNEYIKKDYLFENSYQTMNLKNVNSKFIRALNR